MFYQPFDPTTLKVYDLTRSTITEPYVLDYGFSKVAGDRRTPDALDKFFPIECMLSPEEIKVCHPHMFFTKDDLSDMIKYSIEFLGEPDEYRLGYTCGYNDVVNFKCRKTFEIENLHTVSFLVGYEAGVYVAIMFRSFFKYFI